MARDTGKGPRSSRKRTAAEEPDLSLWTGPDRESALGRVRDAASRGALAHALLFTGEGDRMAAARYAAAAYQCTGEQGGVRPCGNCPACRKVLRDIHPDVITVRDPDHRNIAVDVIRRMREDAWVRPNEGIRKVYLFPDCAVLTEQDQNVLLKVVEEGPAYAAFVFCARSSAEVLQTVRSRCMELKLSPVPRGGGITSGNGIPSGGGVKSGKGTKSGSGIKSGNVEQSGGGVNGTDSTSEDLAQIPEAYRESGPDLCRRTTEGALSLAEWAVKLESPRDAKKRIPREALEQVLAWSYGAFAAALLLPYRTPGGVANGGAYSGANSGAYGGVNGNAYIGVNGNANGGANGGAYGDIPSLLAERLSRRQLVSALDILRRYHRDCAYNIGVSHLLGALAADLADLADLDRVR